MTKTRTHDRDNRHEPARNLMDGRNAYTHICIRVTAWRAAVTRYARVCNFAFIIFRKKFITREDEPWPNTEVSLIYFVWISLLCLHSSARVTRSVGLQLNSNNFLLIKVWGKYIYYNIVYYYYQ